MKTKKHIKISFRLLIFLVVLTAALLTNKNSSAQLFGIKKWTGTYPDMNKSYPVVFIAFKGMIPHVFIRYYPTHNYKDLIAKSVVDGTEIAGKTKTDLLKSVLKIFERSLMKGRLFETGEIKLNTKKQNEIAKKIFEARFEQLGDLWELAQKFVLVYQKVDRFQGNKTHNAIKNTFEKEAGELFMRFLFVNLLESDHGQKIDAFSTLKTEITHLLGELDYTFKKLQYFESFGQSSQISYSFLIQ